MRSRSIFSGGPSAARINTHRRWAGSTRSPSHPMEWPSRRCPCRHRRGKRFRITSSWFRRAAHATPPACCGRSVPQRAPMARSPVACIASRSWPPPWRAALLAGDLPGFGRTAARKLAGQARSRAGGELDGDRPLVRDRPGPGRLWRQDRRSGRRGVLPLLRAPASPRGRDLGLRDAGLMPFPFAFDDRGCIVRDDPVPGAAPSRSRFTMKGPAHETANAR